MTRDHFPTRPLTRRQRIEAKAYWFSADVVIPFSVHDRQWLPEAVLSIQRQQFARTVIHLVDDRPGSPDRRERMRELRELAVVFGGDVRVYLNTDAPIGPYRSTMRIFDRLETPWLAIQDADDRSLPHRLHTQISELIRRRADMASGNMLNFVNPGETNPQILQRLRHQPLVKTNQKWSTNPSGSLVNGTMVVRRDFFEDLNGFAGWQCAADNEFQERAQHAGGIVVHIEQNLGERRLHGGSMTHARWFGSARPERQNSIDECLRRLKLFAKDGCDYRVFGGLDAERNQPATIRITPGEAENLKGRFS